METLVAYEYDWKLLPKGRPREYIGIIMKGLAPVFYKIKITPSLALAVQTAKYPRIQDETIVQRYTPSVPNQYTYMVDGMRPIVNREIIFGCYQALTPLMMSMNQEPQPQPQNQAANQEPENQAENQEEN